MWYRHHVLLNIGPKSDVFAALPDMANEVSEIYKSAIFDSNFNGAMQNFRASLIKKVVD